MNKYEVYDTQQDKDLLLRDLSARLPYGFIVHRYSDNVDIKINTIDDFSHFLEYSNDEKFKPYLRPMSSMTEDEKREYYQLQQDIIHVTLDEYDEGYEKTIDLPYFKSLVDFYNSHHLDYRGLIERGLALEAPKDMYVIKEQ